ncbi:Endoplasmic reticulum aminopeptidase 1, partial [Stegodyphus mimosarum]
MMPDKPYKRLKRSKNEERRVSHIPNTAVKTGRIIYSKQEVPTILAAVVLTITLTSFATPAASCSAKFDLTEYECTTPDLLAKEREEGEQKAKTGEVFPWNNIFLPSFIVPLHYDLFMFPNLKTFENVGSVNITFQVTEPTNFIVLHSKELNLSRISVFENDIRGIPVLQHLEYPKNEQLYIKIDGNFLPNLKYKLWIEFRKELEEGLEGFYLSSYTTSDGQKRYLATTNFEPTAARTAFPCFDEPAMKATFQLVIVHEKNYKAYFNFESLQTAPYSEEFSITSFQKTVKMSTYLVAFMVCDFKERAIINVDGVKVRVLIPAEQYEQSEFALEIAADVLHFCKTFFNIPYPLSKLDMAAIPDFAAGAMENWGLATFRMINILYDPSETSSEGQERVASVIAHEVAHQWFGNLVTMKWWSDLWLNEGFASFMESLIVDIIKPDWKKMDAFVATTVQDALSMDGLQTSHPIVTNAIDPLEIDATFDVISYKKGASLLSMLANFLGMDTLKNGLSNYLNKYRFQNARTEDLWNAFSEAESSHINVTQVMDTWTRQKGYPLITVTLEHPTVKVKQERFLLTAKSNSAQVSDDVSPYGYKWRVPVTYVTDLSNRQNTYWLNEAEGEFVLPAETKWLKVNSKEGGFYRVMYDHGLWKTLTELLQSNHKTLTAADRSNLVDDALSLSRAGILDAMLAFNVTRYLEKEEEFAPWAAAILHFEQLNSLMQDNPAVLSLFQKYILKLLKPAINRLGWEDKGSHME